MERSPHDPALPNQKGLPRGPIDAMDTDFLACDIPVFGGGNGLPLSGEALQSFKTSY
jgi:hypothetical protein